jgi:hypothetical protein
MVPVSAPFMGRMDIIYFQGDDPFGFETISGRHSTLSSVGGRDPFQDEMRYMRDEADHYGGTLTPSVGGGTMQDEFKYMVEEPELRHRSETPSKLASCGVVPFL